MYISIGLILKQLKICKNKYEKKIKVRGKQGNNNTNVNVYLFGCGSQFNLNRAKIVLRS